MSVDDRPTNRALGMAGAACAAVSLPLLLAVPVTPDSVIYNQLCALGGWGGWLLVVAGQSSPRPAWQAVLVFAAVLACALLGSGWGVPALAALMLAVAAIASAATASSAAPIAMAWAVAGALCVVVAVAQMVLPQLVDGFLIASNSSPGRAVGNMRQPNHLATALLCAMVWTAWLWQVGRLRGRWAAASIVAMVAAVAMSASRTGALSLGVLVLWAAVDRGLPRRTRWTLALTPLVYFAAWGALAVYAQWDHAHFYGAERLQSASDISSSRLAIWRNALVLLAQNPWTGVGWGNFNFAWTFTPFPDRPVAFFDHTHNLPLQLAVEIGIPATLAVLGLLGWALWGARRAWQRIDTEPNHPARAALVMLTVLAVHSLLEYPLWYAYFLLPGAWALGLFLGSAPLPVGGMERTVSPGWVTATRAAGALMLLGAGYAAWDHRRIEAIFAPVGGDAPLAQRIAEGRKSMLFGHHADYAAATTTPRDQRLESFRRPLHQLVDVRLLIAYIEALHANGRSAEALYAAQRLREFQRDDAQAYFQNCRPDEPAQPFQCDARPVALTWRDLEP